MKIEYQIYSPGGNVTALITAPRNLGKQECLIASEKIMKQNPTVEQVAVIEKVEGNVCKMRMVGGEFCGNACRCVAEYMRKNFGQAQGKIVINDIDVLYQAENGESKITVGRNNLVKNVFQRQGESFIAELDGIVIGVVDSSVPTDKKKEIKDFIDARFNTAAIGVMFVNEAEKRQNPFVWVKGANTFFNETGCVSGSIASALYLQSLKGERAPFTVPIRQPSGYAYDVSFIGGNISVSGAVSFVETKYLDTGTEKANGNGKGNFLQTCQSGTTDAGKMKADKGNQGK